METSFGQILGDSFEPKVLSEKLGERYEIMRGYFQGRYRDNNYIAAQLEYRIRVWWRFGMVGFIGAGDVADKISTFDIGEFKYSYGAGLRFRIDETELLDLRIDIGFGKNTSGFYFHYNQAF